MPATMTPPSYCARSMLREGNASPNIRHQSSAGTHRDRIERRDAQARRLTRQTFLQIKQPDGADIGQLRARGKDDGSTPVRSTFCGN